MMALITLPSKSYSMFHLQSLLTVTIHKVSPVVESSANRKVGKAKIKM